MPLTPKQQRFVDEYVVNCNATAAYKRTGSRGKGRTAEYNPSRLLGNAGVAAEIKKRRAALAAKTEVTATRLLHELACVAFSGMTNYVNWGPEGLELKPSDSLTRDEVAPVKEVARTETKYGDSKRIKLHDKIAALDKLAKHLL